MFGSLAFLVNDKMCINIGEDVLMCRFDPERTGEIAERDGFLPVVMREKNSQAIAMWKNLGLKRKKKISLLAGTLPRI